MKVWSNENIPIGVYASSAISKRVRIYLFYLAHSSDSYVCFVNPKTICEVLGLKLPDGSLDMGTLRSHRASLVRSGHLTRETVETARGPRRGYRASCSDLPEANLVALNATSPKITYCNASERDGILDALKQEARERQGYPDIFPYLWEDLDDITRGRLTLTGGQFSQDWWGILGEMWSLAEFDKLLDFDQDESKTFWKSLRANVWRNNSNRLTAISDERVRMQTALMGVAWIAARRDGRGKPGWSPKGSAASYICKTLQWVSGLADDRSGLPDPELVAGDIEVLDAGYLTVAGIYARDDNESVEDADDQETPEQVAAREIP